MSLLRNVYTTMADSPSTDGFGNARVSSPYGIFEVKFLYDNQPVLTLEKVTGGSSISYTSAESAITLTAGSGTTDQAIKQSRLYIAYTPGKSNLIKMTGVIGAISAASARRIGYFDDKNGLFFECSDNLYVVERSDTTGSVVDIKTARGSWNLDPLDGSGPSGVTLYPDRAQIFVIDFQWLGVGRVRYGFVIDGALIYCHQSTHANNLNGDNSPITKVYMRTPSLPIRWEIKKLSGSTTPSIKAICAAVASEGGYIPLALRFSKSTRITTRPTSTARTPIFAVRLKNTFGGKENRRTLRFLGANIYATGQDHLVEVDHITDAGSVTANWTSAGDTSAAEYSLDVSNITLNSGTQVTIQQDMVLGTNKTAGASVLPNEQYQTVNQQLTQNYNSTNSQLYVAYATAFSGTGDISIGMNWLEFD